MTQSCGVRIPADAAPSTGFPRAEIGLPDPSSYVLTAPAEPPAWVLEAARDGLREEVRTSAVHQPSGSTATALDLACPIGASTGDAGLDAGDLVAGIVGLARLVNWAQAMQQHYIAALAQPDVVTSSDELLNLACASLSRDRMPDEPIESLRHDEYWGAQIRQAAAKTASAEIGAALHISPRSARNRVEHALTMTTDLPATLAAQHSGDLDGYRAKIISERTTGLSTRQRRYVEQQILPLAATRSPGRLRTLVDKHVIALNPDAARRREHHAYERRGTFTTPDEDGMANLTVHAAAADVQIAHDVLDQIATAAKTAGLGEGRGQSQLRADAFTALFRDLATTGHFRVTDGSPATETEGARQRQPPVAASRHTPIRINVYVNASTLAGLDDSPAELAGQGIISADYARDLARSATAVRTIITTPAGDPRGASADRPSPGDERPQGNHAHLAGHSISPVRARLCGTLFDAGRTIYRTPARTAEYIAGRDRTCCFPGCATSATRCDIDHRQAFNSDAPHSGGATYPCNLDALCRFHHLIKTFTTWRATPADDGTLTWTAPTGRRYPTEPAHPLYDTVSATTTAHDPPPF